jgi:hypothetical protein
METIIDQTQLLINASIEQDIDLNTQLKQSKITIENMYNSSVQLKDQETSMKAVVKTARHKTNNNNMKLTSFFLY